MAIMLITFLEILYLLIMANQASDGPEGGQINGQLYQNLNVKESLSLRQLLTFS